MKLILSSKLIFDFCLLFFANQKKNFSFEPRRGSPTYFLPHKKDELSEEVKVN